MTLSSNYSTYKHDEKLTFIRFIWATAGVGEAYPSLESASSGEALNIIL